MAVLSKEYIEQVAFIRAFDEFADWLVNSVEADDEHDHDHETDPFPYPLVTPLSPTAATAAAAFDWNVMPDTDHNDVDDFVDDYLADWRDNAWIFRWHMVHFFEHLNPVTVCCVSTDT